MKKWLFVLSFFISLSAGAQSVAPSLLGEDERSTALWHLGQIKRAIFEIRPFVEEQDLARLDLISEATLAVREHLEKNNLANVETMNQFRSLTMVVDFSRDFFNMISMPKTEKSIKNMLDVSRDIIKSWGFTYTNQSKLTSFVFNQMHELLQSLTRTPGINVQLKAKIQNLVPVIGDLVAEANVFGDTNKIQARGLKIYEEVNSMYGEFREVLKIEKSLYNVLEIMRLNESYKRFTMAGAK